MSEITVQEPISEKNNETVETRSSLIEKLKEVLKSENVLEIKNEVASIKQLFYKIQNAETNKKKAAFLAEGGEEENFVVEEDDLEKELKVLLNDFKERKNAELKKIQQQEEQNLLRKQQLIERLIALEQDNEDAGKAFPAFKEIQNEWNEIGNVPADKAKDIYTRHQQLVEQFYDFKKISDELRDYDFKKNKEAKEKLLEQAEALSKEEDIIKASKVLQTLHEEWKKIGPVAKEYREEMWNKFKEFSSIINKRHQQHFDDLKAREKDIMANKEHLSELIEKIDYEVLKTRKDWEKKIEEVLNIQEQWKAENFVSRSMNEKAYTRFRAACDAFFKNKNDFFKGIKEELHQNLAKKMALCEQAEALKDSTNWRSTTDKLVKLQQDWKAIGQVPYKQGEAVWTRFKTACDYFFKQKEEQTAAAHQEEENNYTAKEAVIEKIKALKDATDKTEALKTLKGLIAEYNAIGFVPFKKKDKIYKMFREAVNQQFEALQIDKKAQNIESFKLSIEAISEKSELLKERDKMIRVYENIKNEINTYKNNMGFLNVKSNKSNSLVAELEKKIEKLQKESESILEKIKIIENSIEK